MLKYWAALPQKLSGISSRTPHAYDLNSTYNVLPQLGYITDIIHFTDIAQIVCDLDLTRVSVAGDII